MDRFNCILPVRRIKLNMETKNKKITLGIGLIFLEASLLFALFSFIPAEVIAGIGNPNATVITELEIGNVFPEVLNVSLDDGAANVVLIPADTKMVQCAAIVRDFNGESDIDIVNATFYDSVSSFSEDSDDNNDHYTNSSCDIITSFSEYDGQAYSDDDEYQILANCTFEVEYYANPENWICNVTAYDNSSWEDKNTDSITVSELLALGLPNTISYGEVNATYVSEENITNITNYGNVEVNLSLEGYGATPGDGLAMNCTLGSVGTIADMYEKYNLTASTPGDLSLSEFEAVYVNLTSEGTPAIRQFDLSPREDDTINEAIKESYWRIYVPRGVAGTCNGTVIFGAVQSAAD